MVLALGGCQSEIKEEVVEKHQPVEIIQPIIGNVTEHFTTVGRIEGAKSLTVTSPISGKVNSIKVKSGDLIGKGSILFQVIPDETLKGMELQIMKSKLDFDTAHKSHKNVVDGYERIQKLYDANAVSKSEYETSKLQFEQSEMQLTLTEQALINARASYAIVNDRYQVKSPIAGEVIRVEMEEGQDLSTETYIKISSNKQKIIKIGVPENVIHNLQLNAKSSVRIAALDQTFDAKVMDISKDLDASSGLYPVKVYIEDQETEIVDGLFGEVEVEVNHLENQLLLPLKMLLYNDDIPYVYVVKGDNEVEKRRLKLGKVTGNNVQVVDGLNEKDLLVYKGQELLSPSSKIQIVQK